MKKERNLRSRWTNEWMAYKGMGSFWILVRWIIMKEGNSEAKNALIIKEKGFVLCIYRKCVPSNIYRSIDDAGLSNWRGCPTNHVKGAALMAIVQDKEWSFTISSNLLPSNYNLSLTWDSWSHPSALISFVFIRSICCIYKYLFS